MLKHFRKPKKYTVRRYMTVIHTNKQMNKSAEQNYIEREEETSGGEPSLEHQGKMWKLDAHIRRIIKKKKYTEMGRKWALFKSFTIFQMFTLIL